jgi:hypothetical protein
LILKELNEETNKKYIRNTLDNRDKWLCTITRTVIDGKTKKEQKQRQKKEQQRKAAKLKEEKYKEAEKYLTLKNDNSLIWNIIENNSDKYKKSIYESSATYKKRIKNLNSKLFNRKFIFDYKSDIITYDAETKILYLPFKLSSPSTMKYFKHDKNLHQIELTLKAKKTQIPGLMDKKYILSDLPHKNVKVVFYTYKKNKYMGVIMKENCSPSEAKKIQNSWKIRFITSTNRGLKTVVGSITRVGYKFDKTDMIIVYNKYNNEIYKVLY